MSEIVKPTNRLLAALPAQEYARLLPKLKETSLIFTEIIYEPGDVIRDVYFPNSGIVSLLSAVEDRYLLEVGIVGNEGFVGLPVALGVKKSSNRALVQGAGIALKMKTADFLAECAGGGALPRLLQRYTHTLLMQISQSAACSRYHQSEARLARWLLMTADRMQSEKFQITQKFLSDMVGVRREAVSKSAANLQQQQLISYSRGNVTIVDRTGLEATACNCYSIIKNEEKNLAGSLKKK